MNISSRTLVVIGDSIAAGLGVSGHAFPDLIALMLDQPTNLQNLSGSGQTISDGWSRLPDVIASRPDCVIIAFGNYDAVVRPVDEALRWVPPKWRAKGWLDPRPYFSRQLCKGLYQRIESSLRWRYRIMLLRIFGGEPATSSSDFLLAARAIVYELVNQTSCMVFLLKPSGIDSRFYPKTPESMDMCADALSAVAEEFAGTGRVVVGDASGLLNRWSDFFDDHFHPNAAGHKKIAAMLANHISESFRPTSKAEA